ncbi:hypothetical protein EV174_004009 [Coemansia sp. RSA 2320]|nr:hypothetical protein EV174_004009 [Coemansia sp. RSA 2320]
MSFPREAARVFGEKTSASRVLMCIRASATPLDIRLILVSLASRWCVLLKPEPRAARYLASIVDSFYHHNGLSPSLSFLPPTPPRMRIQAEWPYPTSEPDDESRIFMYTTPVVGKAQSGTASRSRSSSAEAQRPHMNGASSGRVSAQSSAPHSSGPTDLPVDQLERMDNCAQELTSLGGMLIDNLVTLPIDEDPQTNKVIQDTLKEVNRLNSIVANYISALTSEHTLTTRRLKLATDETKRCHWVYKDSVAAFTEWSYRQLDYAAKTSNRLSMALPSSAAGSSLSAQPRQQQQAAKAMQSTVAGAALATPPSSEEMAPSILRNAVESLAPPALARVSTKAKGKMPDMGPPSPLPRTAHTN